MRNKMVEEQIISRGVKNTKVLDAMRKVPRHKFVPPEQIQYAYEDFPLSIGHKQTISQPYIVGFMTEAVDPGKDDKILEIGTGSGYQAAVLSEIVSSVYSLEIIPELGSEASGRLKDLGYSNVKVRIADGYYGWKEEAPFDAIIVTAAATEVPEPLFEQLKEGGRMVIPIGSAFSIQDLVIVTKKKGKMKMNKVFSVRFVPFTRYD